MDEQEEIQQEAIDEKIEQPVEEGRTSIAEEIRALIRDELREGLKRWDREQQALRAKLRNRINKDVERQVAAMKSAGINPTQEQIQKIYESVQDSIVEEFGDNQPHEEAVQPSEAVSDEQALLQRDILAIMEEAGVTLEQTDPEIQLINTNAATRYQFLKSIEKAVQAKKDRLSGEKSSRASGNIAAAPALSGKGADSGDLKQKYIDEMLAARGQGRIVGQAIKEKYRKLGVPVDDIGFTILSPR